MGVLVNETVADRSTNLWRELAGEWADWTPDAQMRASVVNALRIANWQRTEDAAKRTPHNFPEPLLPPGIEIEEGQQRQTERFGNVRMTVREADNWLGWG